MAIKKALGEAAYKTKISSTKGVIGHTLGAAGGIEAAICCKVCDSPPVGCGCTSAKFTVPSRSCGAHDEQS